ncbi:MAG: Increased rDNA silencing protein [Trichoglossum hirsutum]|nr:MAG: Increased rDNA silencing protein [Trichoglossum hirsutum]
MATRSPSRMSPLQRERHSSRNSTDNVPPRPVNQSAALKGASRAFVKVPAKPKTQATTYSGTNGAMAAATVVGMRSNSPTGNKSLALPTENRGGAAPGDFPLSAAQQSFVRDQIVRSLANSSSSSSLRVPGDESSRGSTSPSNIAATLAAARFTPQNTGNTSSRPNRSPNRAGLGPMNIERHHDTFPAAGSMITSKQRFVQLDQGSGGHSRMTSAETPTMNKDFPVDTTPISPATSLIGLFEHNQSNVDPLKVNRGPLNSISAAPVIQSPKPIRPPSRSTPLTAAILATRKSAPSKKEEGVPRPHIAEESHRPTIVPEHVDEQNTHLPLSPSRYTHPKNTRATTLSHDCPTPRNLDSKLGLSIGIAPSQAGMREAPPPPKRTWKVDARPTNLRRASPALETESDDSSSVASYVSAPDIRKNPPIPPPRRKQLQRTNTQITPPHRRSLVTVQEGTKSSGGEFQTYSMAQQHPGTPSWLDGRPASSSGERRMRLPAQRMTPHITSESFANAVAASSLASSRVPSPSKSPAPPPLPSRHHHLIHQRRHQNSRTPSPTRGMRHTMRKPPKSDDESRGVSATHTGGRRNLIKKAPNKHHEGNRRRWRDEITVRERKRYEGVWAANKGLHISIVQEKSQPPEEDWREDVSNLVVQDIWSRSRLGNAILEEIWELVDRRGSGRLTREEFVVGMWLIDQKLKGRKLPVKISSSVWGSVRKLGGLKMPRRKE